MKELICNLHIHSRFSDGSGSFQEILRSAYSASLDVIITTDHNILVAGEERYYGNTDHRVLHLIGEEVHDQTLNPQHNHALVIGCPEEAAAHAANPQKLIDFVRSKGGLVFLAHPFEKPLPIFNEEAITWTNWNVDDFTGIELWNGFSEFKTVVHDLTSAIFFAFFPRFIPHQPLPEMLEKWSQLLARGKRITAVAGSDAHALQFRRSFFKKTIFPYLYHFTSINNHLLVSHGLTGSLNEDKALVYEALANGSSFIGVDGIAPSNGFTFNIDNGEYQVGQGGSMVIQVGATLKVSLPSPAEALIFRDQTCIFSTSQTTKTTMTINESGAYRVEVYRHHLGKRRGWIYSNPIYIRKIKS